MGRPPLSASHFRNATFDDGAGGHRRTITGGNPVNASHMHQQDQAARHPSGSPRGTIARSPKRDRAGPYHRAFGRSAAHGFGALAIAVCSVALVSACAGPAPSAHVAAAASPAPPAAPAVPPATAGPSDTAPPSGPSSSPTAAAVPRCQNLDVSLSGAAEVRKDQQGHYQYPLRLTVTNLGKASCSVYGYPGLGLLDASHRALPPLDTHWGSTIFARDPGPSLIVLAPQRSAEANLAIGWRPTPWATYLEITPPNEYHHDLTSIRLWLETAGMHGGLGGSLTATAMTLAPVGHCGCQ